MKKNPCRENLAENVLLAPGMVALTRSAELANPRVIGLLLGEQLEELLLDAVNGGLVALAVMLYRACLRVHEVRLRKRRTVHRAPTEAVAHNPHGLVGQLVQGGGNTRREPHFIGVRKRGEQAAHGVGGSGSVAACQEAIKGSREVRFYTALVRKCPEPL